MKSRYRKEWKQPTINLFIAGCCAASLMCSGCAPAKTTLSQPQTEPKPTVPSSQVNDSALIARAKSEQHSTDWQQFRGPGFASKTSAEFPLQWEVDNGIVWEQGLLGRGASSPIVSGDRIFLTAYSGYGLTVKDAGDIKDLRHHLLCLDRATGEPLWQREMTGTRVLQKVNPELVKHGFASATPVTDGKNVYVSFGVTGVFAFDLDGNLLWQRNLGLQTHYFGSSSSPVLHGDLLIINASLESQAVYALNKNTGVVEWRIHGVEESWSMPVIGLNSTGGTEMIISSKNHVKAYDPKTGTPLWHCAGIQDYVVSVPIIANGICYLTGGKQKQTMAIRMGGKGDAEKQKLWEVKRIGANVSSPVYKNNRLFIFHDNGILQVVNAENGSLVTRQRTATKTRPYASPLLAGDHLYMPFQDAGISVFKADDKCEEVAVNSNRDEAPLMASVVPSGDVFLYRNDNYLVCVGNQSKPTAVNEWQAPTDFKTVQTHEPYNIDPEKGRTRRYLGFLTPDFEQTSKYLLIPYKSVITDEQTAQSRQIIKDEKPKYDALRAKFDALQWEDLTTPTNSDNVAKLRKRWADLETETLFLTGRTRVLVQNLFSKKQMQQHTSDAKAGVSHLPPGQGKKGKK